jgi:hypothetical protein
MAYIRLENTFHALDYCTYILIILYRHCASLDVVDVEDQREDRATLYSLGVVFLEILTVPGGAHLV